MHRSPLAIAIRNLVCCRGFRYSSRGRARLLSRGERGRVSLAPAARQMSLLARGKGRLLCVRFISQVIVGDVGFRVLTNNIDVVWLFHVPWGFIFT